MNMLIMIGNHMSLRYYMGLIRHTRACTNKQVSPGHSTKVVIFKLRSYSEGANPVKYIDF